MPVNDIISQADYNNIRNKVIGVLGVGSGNSGYGQSLNSAAVAEGSRVTINEYANLRFDIINAWVHQVGSAPSAVAVAVGNTVRFSAVDAPVTTYDALANTLVTNRFNLGAGQSAIAIPDGGSTSSTWPGIYGTTWDSRIACTINVNWPTADQARFFFNSGGQIRIASTRTATTLVTQQALAWTTLLNSAGTQSFGGNNPSTDTSPSDGRNWYRLTNSFQEYHRTSSGTPYGANSWRLSARTTDIANNASGTAATSQFLVEFIDNYVDPGPPAPGDAVDGTFSLAVSYLYATGILEPVGAGNFTVPVPVLTVGQISP
jgi:hypothetical protein